MQAKARVGRHIAAATLGNALEFYDFITYGFFAIQIGHAFFPSHNAYASLMLSLATFGAGFVTRPLGALVIGGYADRVGRRPAMMLSFTLMGGSIIALALIPSYAMIGLAAPVLAVAARMIQGFSLGGEVGPATAFLMEVADERKRGQAVAWQGASQGMAAMTAGLVGVGLSALMPPAMLDTWGWRVAMLLGAVTLPVGLWIRSNLPETLHASQKAHGAAAGPGALTLVRRHWRIIVIAMTIVTSSTIATYLSSYLTTFAQATLKMTPMSAFIASAALNASIIVGAIIGGRLTDRFGRRPLLIWPTAGVLVGILPVYAWIIHARSPLVLAIGPSILAFVGSLRAGAFYTAVTESLPVRIRAGAFGLIYASMVALFGGTTQLTVTWLLHVTGNPMALAWYHFATAALGGCALLFIVESAPARLCPALAAA
ncbi:MAG TPA: MFS transporter [Caulobacteraceae bacterium]|jgi:MFS family permease